MELHQTTLSLVNELKVSLINANQKENIRSTMPNANIHLDDSESDDQGRMSYSPLSLKSVLKTEEGGSNATLSTSPFSSSCSSKSYNLDGDHSITFNDNLDIREIDCNYTHEHTRQLWFTKTEYDHFLQACDEDAQKSEAHEKELRVAKLKKEIRKQRRQRRKEEKRLQQMNKKYGVDSDTDIMDLEMDDDIIDDSLDEAEPEDPKENPNEDEEGWLCNLGLEAWTLEGYTTREHNRQKAIDAVLNEQYAAWDRGMVENTEMMSALYFAASATSKHSASKKGKELEEDIQEQTLISTLEDYNKAVQAMNVLQKTLFCIRSKTSNKGGTKANRRGSNESTASDMIDRALGITVVSDLPTMPLSLPPPPIATAESEESNNNKKSTHPPPASSSSARKKYIQRKSSGTPRKIYKSKASTSIIVAPPTPPVVKARRVKRPSIGGPPLSKSNATAINMSGTTITTSSKSPKCKKIVYKSSPATPSSKNGCEKSIKSKKTTSSKDITKKKKKKAERRKSMGDVPKSPKGDKTKPSKGAKHSKAKRRNSNTYDKESASVASKLLKKVSSASCTKKMTSKNSKNAPAVASDNEDKKEHWWFQQQAEAAQ